MNECNIYKMFKNNEVLLTNIINDLYIIVLMFPLKLFTRKYEFIHSF